MEKQTKLVLFITGGVIVLGAISFGIYLLVKDKKSTEEKTKGDSDSSSTKPTQINNYYNTTNPSTGTNPSPDSQTDTGNTVNPKYNSEKELSNPFGELKGRVLYPKRKEVGGWGYANVRSSAEVNTEQAWWDPFDNLLTTINSGTPIGKVTEETSGLFNGYSYRWFKVKLLKPVGFWGDTYDGYVRADTVTIKPYEK